MLKRITTSQIIVLQLALGIISSIVLAVVIHYPDGAHRPMPPPSKLLLALMIVITVGIITLGGAGVQSAYARTGSAIISTIVVWLLASYALIFVWINTYGT
jgi:uncharacterized membrane protein (GlpM family)